MSESVVSVPPCGSSYSGGEEEDNNNRKHRIEEGSCRRCIYDLGDSLLCIVCGAMACGLQTSCRNFDEDVIQRASRVLSRRVMLILFFLQLTSQGIFVGATNYFLCSFTFDYFTVAVGLHKVEMCYDNATANAYNGSQNQNEDQTYTTTSTTTWAPGMNISNSTTTANNTIICSETLWKSMSCDNMVSWQTTAWFIIVINYVVFSICGWLLILFFWVALLRQQLIQRKLWKPCVKFLGYIRAFSSSFLACILCFIPITTVSCLIASFFAGALVFSRPCRKAASGVFVRPLYEQRNFRLSFGFICLVLDSVMIVIITIIGIVLILKTRKTIRDIVSQRTKTMLEEQSSAADDIMVAEFDAFGDEDEDEEHQEQEGGGRDGNSVSSVALDGGSGGIAMNTITSTASIQQQTKKDA